MNETMSTSGNAGQRTQRACPITGKPIDKDLYVEQDNKRIHVCCTDCLNAVRSSFPAYAEQLESQGIDLSIEADEAITAQSMWFQRRAA